MIFNLSNEGIAFFMGFDIMLLIWLIHIIFERIVYEKKNRLHNYNALFNWISPATRINDIGEIEKRGDQLKVPIPPTR